MNDMVRYMTNENLKTIIMIFIKFTMIQLKHIFKLNKNWSTI